MSNDNTIRPEATGLSMKEVLLEVRSDVKEMKTAVDVLVSQELNKRVRSLEDWKNRSDGRAAVIGAAAGLGASAGVAVLIHVVTTGAL